MIYNKTYEKKRSGTCNRPRSRKRRECDLFVGMSANLESRGGGLEIRVHKTPTALVPPSRNVASATALALPNGETQRSNYYRTGERIYLSWGFVLFFPAPAYAAPVTGASWIALWRKRENDEDEPSSQHWKQRSPSPIAHTMCIFCPGARCATR